MSNYHSDSKSKRKEPEEVKLKEEDSEAFTKIKKEHKKMRMNLNKAIEDPEKWIEIELSGINDPYVIEMLQKKCEMNPKPPESNSSEI
ncbi:hypothetical protein O181_012972 [Austropuccinia psidii MF-1]|uniref:Uncharacterized protein n=1 Tax=Austropuccinia psidii MF-1 TaxID=1389203 RepID=A0A9Q3BXD6_9BASI|nr:hypothetical protein [Austropuccinia psidii MF-1]